MIPELSSLLKEPRTQSPAYWAAWEKTAFGPTFAAMAQTPQDPQYHGEGDVWTHTQLVCRALEEETRALPQRQREILFLAALLHDIGKVSRTRQEEGRWVSPHHSSTGARLARRILWQEYDLCGTPEKAAFREAVCQLIRAHSVPPHAISDPDGIRKLRQIAANGSLIPDFDLRMLCTLSLADAQGRICEDGQAMQEQILLCGELAKDAGCAASPYPFPSAHTRYSYLSGKNIQPDQPLYDSTWGEVILMSGLPGTGKDTWIRSHCPDLPMVSLDNIRLELGISPTGKQNRVVDTARERAKALLRAHQPFVWNATSISPTLRREQVDLFTAYGASVRIVYLETPWQEQLRRNRNRSAVVPERVICRMLENLTPPAAHEAHFVEWHCI